MGKPIRRGNRNKFQKYISDPFNAFFVWLFFKTFRLMPVRWASAVGAQIGFLLYFIMQRRNKIGLVNLRIAFPDKTQAEHRTILKHMWQHWGRFFAEMPHGDELCRTATFVGLEHLREAARAKQGCFVCSAHLGNWEPAVSAPLFDDYYLNPVYRAANNPWIDKIMFQRRKGVLIPKGTAGVKKMLDVLHNGGGVVILCDQKLREGIDVPFFGQPVKTAPAVANISLKMNLPIFMARSIRQKNGLMHFEVTRLPIEELKQAPDAVYAVMERINQEIENWIRQTPEQWLWVHRRFDKSLYR